MILSTRTIEPFVNLPDLAAVFESLRRGRHLCMADGKLYTSMKAHAEDFEAMFAQLGFELKHHPRDFFYFVDGGNFTELSSRMAVFMFVLIEDLADRGDAIEETLMSRHFRYRELPHLVGERYRQTMRDIGILEPSDLEHVIQTMERFGFASRQPDESFTFRAPAYRFLDLCLDMAAASEENSEDPRPDDDA